MALLNYMQKCVRFMTADSIITYHYTTKIKSIAMGEKLPFIKNCNFH